MPFSVQVIYPVSEGSTFDFDYYLDTHMSLVEEHMGPHIEQTIVSQGYAAGPETPPAYHAVATMLFPDRDAMHKALKAAGPVNKDIRNFTNVRPDILLGKVIA